MHLKFTTTFSLLLLLFVFNKISYAQQPVTLPSPQDTIRVIQIVQAKNLREKTIDSATTIETAAGNVIIKEGLTTTYCDSVIINRRTNIVEAFGNVHINDNDSIHTYAQYLKYIGGERIAYLKKSVKLTDKKGILLSDELEYNLRTGIATYKNGGRVLNNKTVLTSTDGVYYADTKDVIFKKNVHLVDPKYDIRTDSMMYNITNDIATFIAPTHIVSKDGIIDTKSGTYNLKTGEAIFYDKTYIRDKDRFMTGDRIVFDDKKGIVIAEGNAKVVDSINQVTTLAGRIDINTKENSFLAYNKPVMILHKDGDSTYIAADTLFSGLRKYDSITKKTTIKVDTLKKTKAIAINKTDSTGITFLGKKKNDSVIINQNEKIDTVKNEIAVTENKINSDDIILPEKKKTDSLQIKSLLKKDTAKKAMVINLNKKDSAVRYFLGFHHVRIFNDSLQAVSDSLYYSTDDSTFKLFGQPLVWNGKTQIAGDTIYMFTENQKAKQLYVFYNSIIINKTADKLFNQIAGRTLNGYFKDGQIDFVRVKGSPAESIFYPQDDDSAFVGMNRSSGDVIDIFFVKKELNKVKFVNNVDGVMYPIRQTPADKKQLKNFKWLDNRRPKNKLELFE
ncbi:OstA-like protein [Ferruginibacter sp.]